jgi:hypothetical protein
MKTKSGKKRKVLVWIFKKIVLPSLKIEWGTSVILNRPYAKIYIYGILVSSITARMNEYGFDICEHEFKNDICLSCGTREGRKSDDQQTAG